MRFVPRFLDLVGHLVVLHVLQRSLWAVGVGEWCSLVDGRSGEGFWIGWDRGSSSRVGLDWIGIR